MKPFHRLLAGLALTGLLTALTGIATPGDTAWNEPAATHASVTDDDGIVAPLSDTAWR